MLSFAKLIKNIGIASAEFQLFLVILTEFQALKMLFNSFEFLVFLPAVFLIYWFCCPNGRVKNLFLIAASYLFYGWWDVRFLLLIILITVVAFWGVLLIDGRFEGKKRLRTITMASCLVIDFGVLFLFKYFNFFASSFARIISSLGFTPDVPTMDLILPVGISFYTFQAASYVIDVWRGTQKATKDAPAFFVFISFFPQLVAGPIERASNILPQFLRSRRRFTYSRGVSGMKLILWGLFKKMVVADNAAIIVNVIFGTWPEEGTVNLWIGALLFSFQIYGDFSGYSDIAIGSARLFGIDLMKNFSLPYFSKNIAEFWKRWHISLTGWFRDYVYIPLGGNRKGKKRTIGNTAIVFLVSGLWHGANFTYILWGAYHALLFIPGLLLGKRKSEADGRRPRRIVAGTLMMGVTFLLVMIGWVIFRSESVGDSFGYIARMFSHFTPSADLKGKIALMWVAMLVILEWLSRGKETPLEFPSRGLFAASWVRWSFCLALAVITVIFAGNSQEFIYFKF